jgi:hypothetical protein
MSVAIDRHSDTEAAQHFSVLLMSAALCVGKPFVFSPKHSSLHTKNHLAYHSNNIYTCHVGLKPQTKT